MVLQQVLEFSLHGFWEEGESVAGASHVVMISHPDVVAKMIERAAMASAMPIANKP